MDQLTDGLKAYTSLVVDALVIDRDTPPPPPPGGRAEMGRAVLNQQFVSLAVFTAILYDILVTFDQEVQHFYVSSLSSVQVLWFLNRALVPAQIGVHILVTFLPHPSSSLCRIAGEYIGNWIGVVNLLVIQCSLALRTAAIYGRSPRIIFFLIGLLLASTTSRVTILAMHPIRNVSASVGQLPGVCLDFPSQINSAAFYGPVVLDAILYLMTVVKVVVQASRYARNGIRGTIGTARVREGESLFSVLYRDGSVYFLVVAVAMAITVIGFFNRRLLGAFTESDLYIAVCSIACSRLILHLKKSARRSSYRIWDGSSGRSGGESRGRGRGRGTSSSRELGRRGRFGHTARVDGGANSLMEFESIPTLSGPTRSSSGHREVEEFEMDDYKPRVCQ